jgi:hypothetical protein
VRGLVEMSILLAIAVATANIKLRFSAAHRSGWGAPDY